MQESNLDDGGDYGGDDYGEDDVGGDDGGDDGGDHVVDVDDADEHDNDDNLAFSIPKVSCRSTCGWKDVLIQFNFDESQIKPG